MLAAAGAVGAALVVVPGASAQGTDTTAPVLNVGTLTPTAPLQRNGNPPAAPSSSTGNNGWFTHTTGPTVLTLTATDDVAVTKLQYSTDNGATYLDVPITPGPSVSGTVSFTAQGNVPVRYRATDAAGNLARYTPSTTTINQPAAVGATAVRLASTNGRAIGDELIIDTGDKAETVQIATIPSPAPASPAPNVTLTSALTKAHASGAAVQDVPLSRVIPVMIDTVAPTANFPAAVNNNRIGHGAAAITPTFVDTASGGTAVHDMWIDGTWVFPLPLNVSKLSLGKHTWTLGLTDVAGNGNKVTLTFLVTTSFADIDALLARYGTGTNPTIPAATVTSLRASLASAKASNDAGNKAAAISGLEAFVNQVRSDVANETARNLLATDAQDVTRQVRGIADAPAPADLGITAERYPGQPRHPYIIPAMPVHNANAKFKVLVVANKNGDGSFRHPAIEDATLMLQELGAAKGFDVDLWDPYWPTQSLSDTPFTSAANLAQYAVIIGNSSVGNNTFNAAYTMKDGTVVNERAAFKGYINNGGGYVALHAANDSMHTWSENGSLWYQALLGGLFVSHPANQNGFGTDCGSCYWVNVHTEDPSHPSTDAAGKPTDVAVGDELYHFDRKPRQFIHPLMTLDESTYVGAIGVGANASNTEGGDHPIAWCSNFDGGREWSQVLGHNWELFRSTPWFRESIYQGILTAANMKPANCVTHVEVKSLLSSLQASGGITADAATAGTTLVNNAYTKYATLTQSGYSSSLSDIDALRTLAQDSATGDATSRAKLLAKAQELKSWMQVLLGAKDTPGTVGGAVPATLSLTLGTPATFASFVPGLGATYTAGTTANVITTAGDAALGVSDPSANATGRLVNGTFSLAAPVQVKATSPLGAGGALAAVGGSSAPTSVLTYSGPASNHPVALTFSQVIGGNEALRTGTYSKALTFTLSTTTP
jgi:type 1 glutamine amidotransferase